MSIGGAAIVLCAQMVLVTVHAFTITVPSSRSLLLPSRWEKASPRWTLSMGFAQNNHADAQPQQQLSEEDQLFLERFKRRRNDAALKVESEKLKRPPSNSTYFQDPKNVITSVLDGLLAAHDPIPLFGYEILYQSSTKHWQDVLRKSVGAPEGTETELIYRALSKSMERGGHNQFGILVGLGTDHHNVVASDSSSEIHFNGYYTIEFPWDTLDYYDGTAWLECRLRDRLSDELLCVLGWSLEKSSDGSWLIDGIDWQDFREKYRPGVGREEWERICG
eukprot:scaffold3426_cov205-Skeletonema_menzelii.AAC.1